MSAQSGGGNSAMEKIGARVRQRAMTGTEASTIGFILVAYIGAFAGLGYWLDTIFKTSWIVAVGVLAGALIGFREMFRIAQKLTRSSIVADNEADRQKLSQAHAEVSKSNPQPSPLSESTSLEDEARTRPRIFSVPPPPSASFEHRKSAQAPSPIEETGSEDKAADDLIERLLDENDEAVP